MSKNKKSQSLSLSTDDVIAVLNALEMIDAFPVDTIEQKRLNAMCRDSAEVKLMSKSKRFSANEVRIISCALDGALLYLSGSYPEVTIDPELHKDIAKNLFVYNRLAPYFREIAHALGKEYLSDDC